MIQNEFKVLSNEAMPSELIPISGNETFLTKEIGPTHDGQNTALFKVHFLQADGVTKATGVTGNIFAEVIYDDDVLQTKSSGDYPIDASKIRYASEISAGDGAVETYNVPTFLGGFKFGRVRIEGISGASFMKCSYKIFK